MGKESKRQNLVVTVDSGSSAALREFPANLDTSFDTCKQILTNVRSYGGDSNFRIGVSKAGSTIEDPNPNANWGFSSAVPMPFRGKEFGFSVTANDVKMQIENISELSSDLVVEFTFLLERNK